MGKCNRDCFSCRFPDCIDSSFSVSDYIELVELEKEIGVFQREDENYYFLDMLAVARTEAKKERAKRRRQEKRVERKARLRGRRKDV